MTHLVKPEVYDLLHREEQYTKYDCIMSIAGHRIGGTVIDIGCGTGLLIEYLDQNYPNIYDRYICLDPDQEMLSIAMKRNNGYKVIFIQSYAEDNPLRHRSGDALLSISTWGVLSSNPHVLGIFKDLVKENGLVIVTGHPRTYRVSPSKLDSRYVYKETCIDDIYVA